MRRLLRIAVWVRREVRSTDRIELGSVVGVYVSAV